MSTIQTYTGAVVDPLRLRIRDIDIEDIAQSLSNQCRFSGHVKDFYSVAQHSVEVSYRCDPKDALCGLLHDASEAYLVDVPRPVKYMLPDYREAEHRAQEVIAFKFDIPFPFPPSVHEADDRMLITEMRDLMPALRPWEGAPEPYDFTVVAWAPRAAKRVFLARYKELTRANS